MISSIFGIHINIFSVHLSVYYGHNQCNSCVSSNLLTSPTQCDLGLIPAFVVGTENSSDQLASQSAEVCPSVNFNGEFYKARVTSVILLLGVGSYLCYKVYSHLKKRFAQSSSNSADCFSSSTSQSSRRLNSISTKSSAYEGLIEIDNSSVDPFDVELRYFGPESFGDETTSLSTNFDEQIADHSDLDVVSYTNDSYHTGENSSSGNMGNFNSRLTEPVFYNVESGIHIGESASQRTNRISARLHKVLSPDRHKKITATINRIVNEQASPQLSHLPQRPKYLAVSSNYKNEERFEKNSGINSSSYTNDSSAFPSEVESLCDSWSCDERAWSFDGSMKGNFSPTSLRHKFNRMSCELSPDRTSNRLYFNQLSIESFNSDCSGFSGNVRTSAGEALSSGELTREISLDSCASDDSFLTRDVDSVTSEFLDDLSCLGSEIVSVKLTLDKLHEDIVKLNSNGQIGVVPSDGLLDEYDGLNDQSDYTDSSKSAVAVVKRHKARIYNRFLLPSCIDFPLDEASLVSCNPKSLSAVPRRTDLCDRRKEFGKQRAISLPVTPLSVIEVDENDSGSDFGQSLSSDSPHHIVTPAVESSLKNAANKSKNIQSVEYASAGANEAYGSNFGGYVNKQSSVFPKRSGPLTVSSVSAESGFQEDSFDISRRTSIDDLCNVSKAKSTTVSSYDVNSRLKIKTFNGSEDYLASISSSTKVAAMKKVVSVLQISGFLSDSFQEIHDDDLASMRSMVFQALKIGCNFLIKYGGTEQIIKRLTELCSSREWIPTFSFFSEGGSAKEQFINISKDCLQILTEQMNNIGKELSDGRDVGAYLMAAYDSDSSVELKILDAVKLLMMLSCIDLYALVSIELSVDVITNGPVFPFLLFLKPEASSPKMYFVNHLNYLGSHLRLNELDLYVLSYALGVTTRILELTGPNLIDAEDKSLKRISRYYPDWNIGISPEIILARTDFSYLCPS